MAITFEEQKNKTPWMGIIGAVVVLGSLSIAAYYLFFSKPQLAEEILFPKLKSLTEFSKVNTNFAQSLDNSAIKNLKPLVNFNQPGQETIGKANPFVQ